jgi:hypothetical protein
VLPGIDGVRAVFPVPHRAARRLPELRVCFADREATSLVVRKKRDRARASSQALDIPALRRRRVA